MCGYWARSKGPKGRKGQLVGSDGCGCGDQGTGSLPLARASAVWWLGGAGDKGLKGGVGGERREIGIVTRFFHEPGFEFEGRSQVIEGFVFSAEAAA